MGIILALKEACEELLKLFILWPRFVRAFIVTFLIIVGIPYSVFAGQTTWEIKKIKWSAADEKAYEEFITQLGLAIEKKKCRTVETCMASSANIFYKTDGEVEYHSDCADWPYFLRAYFSWKSDLPFSYVKSLVTRKGADGSEPTNKDLRYSSFGNSVVARANVIMPLDPGEGSVNALRIVNQRLLDAVSSANFRVNHAGMDSNPNFSDFYPIKINRDSLKPGTMIYDPNGHVAVVYRISQDGQIYYMDAHPRSEGGGYPLSYGIYGTKFSRSRPSMGAGFKNWRPIYLVNAKQDKDGNYRGGSIVGMKDSELPLFGSEQFYGNIPDPAGRWTKGVFKFNDRIMDFYEFVRNRLSQGNLKLNPVNEIQMQVTDLCSALEDRAFAVETSQKSGVQNKPHPERLPDNIYGTNGEWENESTPSRDARIKTSFKSLLEMSKSLIQRYKAKDSTIQYEGEDLPGDMLKAYLEGAKACKMSYVNSKGQRISLDLEKMRQRVFDMSFDPYHCVELRWGAQGEELSSCPDDKNKLQWYGAERWMRYQIDRTYDARMDYSLSELNGPKPGAGVAAPPDVDIIKYLQEASTLR